MADGHVIVRGTLREYVAALESDRLESLPPLDEAALKWAVGKPGRGWFAGGGVPVAEVMVFGGVPDLSKRSGVGAKDDGAAWHAYCIRDRDGVLRALDGDSYLGLNPDPLAEDLFQRRMIAVAQALDARAWVDTAAGSDGDEEPPGVELTDPEQREWWTRLTDRPGS